MTTTSWRSGTLGSVLANLGWLLAGKGAGALLSLIYLGLATRTLKPEGFGQFTLILGTGQAIVALVSFQSWQVVVRYGMAHLRDGRPAALKRLIGLCAGLDLAGAGVGCVLAVAGVLLLGPQLGWAAELRWWALAFCVVMLLSIRSTPTGILRLHDRYGIGALADAATPVMRLVGALVVVASGASIRGFLLAWAVAEVVTAITYWIFAARVAGPVLSLPDLRSLPRVRAENEGIAHFASITNAGLTLNAVGKQFAVLIVGGFAGPVAAGSYRLAYQLAQALARVSDLFSRALFAELARAHAGAEPADVQRLFGHTVRLALVAAAVVVLLLLAAGRPVLGLVAGAAYLPAYPLLVLLGIAAAFDIVGVGFEPTLMAIGRVGLAFRLRILVTLALLALLVLLLPAYGATGAGVAMLVTAALTMTLFGIAARRAIRTR